MKNREIHDYDNYGNRKNEEFLSRKKLVSVHHKIVFDNIIRYLKDIKTDSNVLDIGCGDGFWLDILRNMGFSHLKGIDLSDIHLKRAENKNHDVEKMSVLELPDSWKEKFDVILMVDLLEHLSDVKSALEKVGELLKPGGKLIFNTVVCDSVVRRIKRIVFKEDRLYQSKQYDQTHVQPFTKKSLLSCMMESNYKIREMKRVANVSDMLHKLSPKANALISKITFFGFFGDLLVGIAEKK